VLQQAGSPTRTVYVDMTLTRSKVKVKVTGLLNFRQLVKPCMLAAMTAAPLRGFLVVWLYEQLHVDIVFVMLIIVLVLMLIVLCVCASIECIADKGSVQSTTVE